ncbi:hypothetical protein AKI39_17555 [Bordetella sp. H567]|nr:hypothetical protein AKI39_17555 [Bordetella sp. H567]
MTCVLAGLLIGAGPAMAQKEKTGKPRVGAEKETPYTVTFINTTSSNITLTLASSQCMYNPGDASFTVQPGRPKNEILDDDNGGSCNGSWKNVIWNSSLGGTVQFLHQTQAGTWETIIYGDHVQSATCMQSGNENSYNCLNQWQPNVVLVDIMF